MPAPDRLVLSCEHGGHRVPGRYARLFRGAGNVLAGHRGWDPGALALARRLARSLGAPLIATTTTRLLVDANRSPHHRELFSAWTATLPEAERERILARHYRPHRAAVERAVRRAAAGGGRVVHVAVHSFAPRLGGVTRRCDVGLLYDPRRRPERAACARWRAELAARLPGLRVRRNFPYRGAADGLTTFLRRRLPASRYLGVELEVSQAHLASGSPAARGLAGALEESLAALLGWPGG